MMGTTVRGLVAAATGIAEVAGVGLRQLRSSMAARGAEQNPMALAGRVREMVRHEVQRSIAELGGASATEVAELRHRLAVLEGRLAAAEAAPPAERATPRPAKKAAAKKASPAKKAAPGKKATAKKAAPGKATPATVAPAEPEHLTAPVAEQAEITSSSQEA